MWLIEGYAELFDLTLLTRRIGGPCAGQARDARLRYFTMSGDFRLSALVAWCEAICVDGFAPTTCRRVD